MTGKTLRGYRIKNGKVEKISGKSTVQVTLRGKWKISVPNQYVKLISTNDTETIIAVQCQHGLSREIQLVK